MSRKTSPENRRLPSPEKIAIVILAAAVVVLAAGAFIRYIIGL